MVIMHRRKKPNLVPGEFKCKRCEVMWSNYMQTNAPCIESTIRSGLHNFDFTNPILDNR